MKKKRLQWAKRYKNWKYKDWSKVIFSDERLIKCNEGYTYEQRAAISYKFWRLTFSECRLWLS